MNMRRFQSASLGLMIVATVWTAAVQTAWAVDTRVYGYWKRLDDDTGKPLSVFHLWQDKGKLIGKIVKTFPKPGEDPNKLCTECSGAQKDKPVVGLIFLWGLRPDEDNPRKWIDGTVLNPENGKTYNVEVELSKDGKSLNVYGYISFLVKLGGTSVWQRASADEAK